MDLPWACTCQIKTSRHFTAPLELQRGRTLTELSVHPKSKTINWSVMTFIFACSYFFTMTWTTSSVYYHIHITDKPPPPNAAEESKLSFKMAWESDLAQEKGFWELFSLSSADCYAVPKFLLCNSLEASWPCPTQTLLLLGAAQLSWGHLNGQSPPGIQVQGK